MKVLSINNSQEETILRSPSRVATDEDFSNNSVGEVIQQVKDTLTYYGNGVWLSAVQIGYPLQIFVINCRPTESFPDMKQFSQVIINPVITHYSDETFDGREWCMSIADENCIIKQRYQVRRSTSITFDYTDEHNIRHTDTSLSWLPAVVFQHEYDHLFGKLIDKIGLPGQIITQEKYLRRKANGEKMIVS
jgi:peptide deformylase